MWELDCEEGWAPKNWCIWTVVLEKTLESPWDCKEIQPVHSEGDQLWDFFGRTDAKAETPVLWPPHAKSWLIGYSFPQWLHQFTFPLTVYESSFFSISSPTFVFVVFLMTAILKDERWYQGISLNHRGELWFPTRIQNQQCLGRGMDPFRSPTYPSKKRLDGLCFNWNCVLP